MFQELHIHIMKVLSKYIFSILLAVIAILSFITSMYTGLIISIVLLLVIMIVNKMGKGIVLRESTAMLYVFTCLLMPLVGYTWYTVNNPLARLWVKYMPVSEDIYFGFALPAITFFCLALTWPLSSEKFHDTGKSLQWYIQKIKFILSNHKKVGFHIIIVGVVFSLFVNIFPAGLQYFGSLFFFGSFAGMLYLYFSPRFRFKNLTLAGFSLFILFNALNTGMFTIVAYMGITIYSFFLIGSKTSFLNKSLILLLAVGFIIVLQNSKMSYRKSTWVVNYEGNRGELFGTIFLEKLSQGKGLITEEGFFPFYSRTNQGFNVALVMKRFPAKIPHDNGNNLLRSIAAAFVPRFLWADKPEAGGKFNMKYYTGITIRGWSTNVGSLGEAYGSFGVTGGIIYMFFLGAFIRWAYKMVFVISKSIPLLICWIPVLFYQVTYSAETDTLQIFNSLIKTALFIVILYKLIPSWFGKSKGNEYHTPRLPVTATA